jgi:hypothetical protein
LLAADLRRIADALETAQPRPVPDLTLTTSPAGPRSKVWLIVTLLLAALAVAGWLLTR